ncbi:MULTISPECIES: carbamoyltransferase family protein [Bradyrhizobium]|uniref:Nodulation protein n=4 Tax=Bradyrhizobium TaxID=374 RepID=A0AAE6CD16_9BRAD|nr:MULTISPECIES: carbamoyltransferase [Bradyrhizobium]MCG2632935.1 carbamoyltransferase [Bradyrhizobium zhengyangense]MCG2645541.1 carbamoyltransferase [Bradyrhizobium zhengyangense]MCG2673138.1 carbamoyltransferase [Bradyrhizobium zhengyangense]MDN4985666.1 carbamoyltransferase [Bradyrhizobium sp. WYCCWR 13022]MDN5006126.1 carbamoyltransferase [Bradyrhizobium sp. WYCCWR 12677]
MLCLGLSGGLDKVHEYRPALSHTFLHDGAAVMVRDGRVLAAVEEERLNRIKHSNKFPAQAIRYCLAAAGAQLKDIDRIAFYATESYCNAMLRLLFGSETQSGIPLDARTLLQLMLSQEFDTEIEPSRLSFVSHHHAHATSAFAVSGYDEGLVLAIDGGGDFLSGMVAIGSGSRLTQLHTFPEDGSLGLFYLEAIKCLGYGLFDEYKVMGLAPYGDSSRFRELFQQFYELKENGGYKIHLNDIAPALEHDIHVRGKGMPFTQEHKDVSAALQEALERIVFHVLRHYREVTGMKRLCLAGGVAHNCTMTGKLLYTGLFDDIFVQPAAHDAGCALGAALMVSEEQGRPAPRERLQHVYWGPALGDDHAVEREVAAWRGHIDVQRSANVASVVAEWIANGSVVGWVQGRSEFGPRALGNRSIVADPRPAKNKDRINAIVKKREGYRPFAPSVLEEHAAEFFDLPKTAGAFPFMNFVVQVRDCKRSVLGAVTHVDGTARLQTVSRRSNPRYWELINQFHKRTGVPVLLNTSFNNNVEPIVQSVTDAMVTFLTTDLDALVIGSLLITKRVATPEDWAALRVSLPAYTSLRRTPDHVTAECREIVCETYTTFSDGGAVRISPDLFELLHGIKGDAALGELLAHVKGERRDAIILELRQLWEKRRICLRPAANNLGDLRDQAHAT